MTLVGSLGAPAMLRLRVSVAGRVAQCLVLVLSLMSALLPRAALAAPPQYSLDFGTPPAHWGEALDEARLTGQAKRVFSYIACGAETNFINHLNKFKADPKDSGEDLALDVLGKLAWLKSTDAKVCSYFGEGNDKASNEYERSLFAGNCDNVITEKGVTLTRDCIAQQVNHVLSTMEQGNRQLGSADLPCYWSDPTHLFDGFNFSKTQGDWDATLRVLVRVAYLAGERGRAFFQLDPDALKHLSEKLLSVDGAPAQESYSLFQCGNQERSTGPAADRVEDTDWTDEVVDSIGDLFSWLLKRLLLIAVAAVALSVLVAIPGGALLAAIAAVGAAGALGIVAFLRIPETENHLMQINSAKYLINQLVITELTQKGEDQHGLPTDHAATREWLLRKMQTMLKQDFVEYNAIPYQRFTLGAIMNLRDFARDANVRDGAQLVLDYYLAKYAVGSSELRRYSPFRRRGEVVRCYVEDNLNQCDNEPKRSVFDLASGANHAVGIMQFFVGPSRSLPADKNGTRFVTPNATYDMLFSASSRFRPHGLIVEFALNKSAPYLERIRLLDGGAEVYSSSRAALISAGGVITGHANSPTWVGITLPNFVASNFSPDGDSDKGVGWPIFLIPHGGVADFKSFDQFIRFNGERVDLSKDNGWAYDHNLCVWRGFACGMDLVFPESIKPCLGIPPLRGGWLFFDLYDTRCPLYAGHEHFFLAAFVNVVDGKLDGYFEVVDAAGLVFDQFTQAVRARNPNPSAIRGVYHSFGPGSGHTIRFDTRGHQGDFDRTGVEEIDGQKVDDIGDWRHADGDVLSGPWDDPVLTITKPGLVLPPGAPTLPHQVRLDFRTWNSPQRVDLP